VTGGRGPEAMRSVILVSMEFVRWIVFVVGILGFVMTWASVLASLVIPRGGRSPTTTTLGIVIRWSFRWTARRCGTYEQVDSILAVQGPIYIILQLLVWLVLFIVDFTLIAWVFTDASLHHTFREVTSSFFTLGFAVPEHRQSLVVDLIAAATGPLIVALQIAYLPTLYSAFARREALITLLDARAGSPPWGPELLARHNLILNLERTTDLYSQWEQWAADVTESHSNYRTLFFFRSPDPWRSWVIGLLSVLDSAALYLSLSPSTAPGEARMCLRMGFSCFRDLAATFDLPYELEPDPDSTPLQLTFEDFEAAVEMLKGVEFPMERSAVEAWPHFRGWRVNYELAAYSIAELITAPPAPWSGTRSVLHGNDNGAIYPTRPEHRAPGGKRFTDRVPPVGA
jgi:hypothetical protein